MFARFLASLCLFSLVVASAQTKPASLRSPDRRLEITFATVQKDQPAESGQLVYSVAVEGKPLIDRSVLRLDFQGLGPLGADVRIVKTTESRTDLTYGLVTGKSSTARDRHNELIVELEETGRLKRKLHMEARAFDEAIAFRYTIPRQPVMTEYRLTKEATEFRIHKDAMTYALVLPNFRSMYESEFLKLPISAFSNQGGVASNVLLGLPLLMDVPGVSWLAITEADVRDYPAMYLVNPSGSWLGHWFEAKLAPSLNEPEIAAVGSLPHATPWRVLMIASNPGKLIESNVLTSLNPESKITDTTWIRAGRAAWDWWSGSIGADGKQSYSTATMRYYTDFAASHGLEYMLVDAGWSSLTDIVHPNGRVDIPELVKYARDKGVRVWIWLHYAPVEAQMAEAFPQYEKWGVAGLKIDFVSRDDQGGIGFYHRVAELAAKHHLMVDFHGSTKPSGIERTWPNVIGYEAVLGMEQNKAGMRDTPDHHVLLPFTRMLAGPMDYTPGGFNNVTRAEFEAREQRPMVMGTRAHHLAMYAVYEAPLQMVADHPSVYEDDPAFEFVRSVPATWDETRFLGGVPGEWVVIARRRGDDWYLGAMNGSAARELEIPLDFLSEGRYSSRTYGDADDSSRFPKKIRIETRPVDRKQRLRIRMASGGGFAGKFTLLK